MADLVLASASPRRKELLEQAGLSLEVVPADVDEAPQPGEAPEALVRRLAAKKARAVAEKTSGTILAADTIVVLPDAPRILNKPRDEKEARLMLTRLQGRAHEVLTAFHVVREGHERGRIVTTEVTLRPLHDAELEGYLASREWEGKAGAYAIQGLAGAFVRTVRGSYTNVVGLPVCEVIEDLLAIGALKNDWLRASPR